MFNLNKSMLELCAGFSLVSSAVVVVFSANPAQAASLTYNWSFDGLANTGGTFVADDATGLLSSMAGTVCGQSILSLMPLHLEIPYTTKITFTSSSGSLSQIYSLINQIYSLIKSLLINR